MTMGWAAVLALGLLAAPSGVAEEAPSFDARIRTAIDDICLPVLRDYRIATDRAAFEKLVEAKGFSAGVSKAQLDLFPPDSPTLSRALLVSGGASESQFVLAIGGVEPSCRLFVTGSAKPETLAANLKADTGWQPAELPAGATPRRMAFIQGPGDKPTALVMIFPDATMPGIAFNIVAYAS